MIKTKVVTGKVRFLYANVFKPYSMNEDSPERYSVSILINKKDTETIEKVKSAIDAALQEGINKLGGKIPKNFKNPLRDGDVDRSEDENYSGVFFLTANSYRKPGIVDKDLDPILDPDEFYSGCYGRASLNFYAYNVTGNKGVACGLNNLQKLEDGRRIGAITNDAKADFLEEESLF